MPFADRAAKRAYDRKYDKARSSVKKQKRAVARQNPLLRPSILEGERKTRRRGRVQFRLDALIAYGGRCACCGERQYEFLAIDHIEGGGNSHRKSIGRSGTSFYVWLKQQKYPTGFQVLCHNCNSAKGYYGQCPHGGMK